MIQKTLIIITLLIFPLQFASADNQKPTWYVFKIEKFISVTHSNDKSYSTVEGVTIKGRHFKIKALWSMLDTGHRTIDSWLSRKMPDHGPYVIAGGITAWDPLTIEVDTLTPRGGKWNAPEENIY